MSQLTAVRQRTRPARPLTTRPKAKKSAPRLRVVQPADTQTTAGVGFVVGCLVLLLCGLLALLLLNTARAQQSFTLDRLQAQSNALSDTQQELGTDLNNVSAPQQLALKAEALGLRPADRIRYVRSSDGKVLGVAKDASKGAPFTVGTLPTTPASRVAGAAEAAATGGLVAVKPKASKKSGTKDKDKSTHEQAQHEPGAKAGSKKSKTPAKDASHESRSTTKHQ